MASGTQVLPGIVHSTALGAILSEYLATYAMQPAGLGSGGVVAVGGSSGGGCAEPIKRGQLITEKTR